MMLTTGEQLPISDLLHCVNCTKNAMDKSIPHILHSTLREITARKVVALDKLKNTLESAMMQGKSVCIMEDKDANTTHQTHTF